MDQTPSDNLVDYYLHETAIVFIILAIFFVVGFCLGWLLTMGSRNKARKLNQERRELLDQYDGLKEELAEEEKPQATP